MFRFTLAIGLAMAMALGGLAVAGPAGAQAKEQVVFSGEGTGSVGEAEFWIWCAVDEAGQYDDCNGAIRFDDLKLARHVEGEVTEIAEDTYQMDVASTLDDAVACTLTNVPPITHGHTNTVDISCSSPSGTATSDDAVVVSTGH